MGRIRNLAVLLASLTAVLAQTVSPQRLATTAPPDAPAVRFTLHQPDRITYWLPPPSQPEPAFLEARRETPDGPRVWLGPRVVLELNGDASLESVIAGRPLHPLRLVEPGFHILDAGDAWTALQQSVDLAGHPSVGSCRPVLRQDIGQHWMLAARPNDPRYNLLWHLENRNTDGTRRGPDIAAREAWATTRGEGVVVAVADDGVELTHPDLSPAASNSFHFNFLDGTTNAQPATSSDYHATLVAGFVLARDNNARGVAGLAPRASLASWKIFNGANIPDNFDDELADMFRYLRNDVHIQNHSWGNAAAAQLGPTGLEQSGLNEALGPGRSGRGVIMVRSAGNDRQASFNANDDGYANDPRVITVGAVDSTGHPTDYSNPGACLLVSAFGGSDERLLTTTDRLGTLGLNTIPGTGDSADYVTSSLLQGTSFSAPQVSGLTALMLAARPDLAIRDVQHLLALGAHQISLHDPDVFTNAAGFAHSHNTGFGIPHAGRVLDLAALWSPLPAYSEHLRVSTVPRPIPDDGLRVLVTGNNVPASLRSLPVTPGPGPHADAPTAVLPLVDLGLATETVTVDLHDKAALIRRSPLGSPADDRNTFEGKIRRAADAGARFAIVYNDRDLTDRIVMGGIEFLPIPGVMMDQQNGTALADALAADPNLRVQLQLSTAATTFGVTPALRCEHVGVRLQTSHPRRGDVRITLLSPQGTRSVLQHLNNDDTAGPRSTWTYWSTRHFGESSLGAWTVEVSDESPALVGTISRVELVIRGVALTDTDADGLDDAWETQWFGNLQASAGADPDQDGRSNAQEALLQTDPLNSPPWTVTLSQLDSLRGLVSWDAQSGGIYDLETATDASSPFGLFRTVTATNREMESVFPLETTPLHLLRLRER